MDTKETPKKAGRKNLTRSKQSRRRMLKSMALGTGAMVAGENTPARWAKPMVNSVLLPAHAQTSISCSVSASALFAQDTSPTADVTDQGNSANDAFFGPFNFPGNYDQLVTGSAPVAVIPQVSVTPGVTDNFNLASDVTGSSVAANADLNQNVSPDPENGAIPFNVIEVQSPTFNITMTLTPDNSEFCGQAETLDISFFSN
ncbi:MAG: hypothetical protein WB783_02365 [Arenicellales bacterium]